ncbi:MAG: D-2-hydroxyacid dehydrogenase [Saprospiraceae bacterium]|nr:D-2-hydroxyacid dehydrogenase [Saprospiraceae bacterium]
MKIVFLDHHTLNADGLSLDGLNSVGEITLFPTTKAEQVLERCKDAEVIITNKVKIQSHHLDYLPHLKLIAVAATGYNNIDIDACQSRSITVCNVRGYSTEAVVQHTFSLILALTNRVRYYSEEVSKGRWDQSGEFSFYDHSIPELNGMVLGIIGYGNIGKRVADVASMMGMEVIAFKRSWKNENHAKHQLVSLETIFEKSAVISLHCPLNEESKGMICQASIEKMKKTALLINTARGGLVVESDLAQALNSGRIAGAGLDTLNQEPPGENPLIGLNNCLVTPHMSWATVKSRKNLLQGIIENIKAFQLGKPINVIT